MWARGVRAGRGRVRGHCLVTGTHHVHMRWAPSHQQQAVRPGEAEAMSPQAPSRHPPDLLRDRVASNVSVPHRGHGGVRPVHGRDVPAMYRRERRGPLGLVCGTKGSRMGPDGGFADGFSCDLFSHLLLTCCGTTNTPLLMPCPSAPCIPFRGPPKSQTIGASAHLKLKPHSVLQRSSTSPWQFRQSRISKKGGHWYLRGATRSACHAVSHSRMLVQVNGTCRHSLRCCLCMVQR